MSMSQERKMNQIVPVILLDDVERFIRIGGQGYQLYTRSELNIVLL